MINPLFHISDTLTCKQICCHGDSLTLKLLCCHGDTLHEIHNSPAIIMNEKILGLSPDNARIMIPVIVTLSIFILGIIINSFIKKIDRKAYLSSIKTILITWGNLVVHPVKQQAASCVDFNRRLLTSNVMQPERFSFNLLLADKMLEAKIKDLIDLIVLNHRGDDKGKSKCMYNIISQIEFLQKMEKELSSKYEIYHHDANQYMEEWNRAITNLDITTTRLRLQYLSNPGHPVHPFYLNVARISNGFIATYAQSAGIQEYQDHLINPISTLCNDFIRENPNEAEVYSLAFVIQDLRVAIRKWNTNKTGTAELFLEFAGRFETTLKTLSQNIDVLEKMKFKWLVYIK